MVLPDLPRELEGAEATRAEVFASERVAVARWDFAGTMPRLRTLTKEVEKQMRKLEKQQASLHEDLAALAGSADHERLAAVGNQLAEVEAALGAAEDEWLALASEAEG